MPVGQPYNGGQSPLEAAAIAARASLLPLNTYNPNQTGGQAYTATHTRALSDFITPPYGKGSGQFLDIENYGGVGGSYDIIGNPTYMGSGREPQLILNSSTWGYGPDGLGMVNYQHPNTAGNIGQIIL